jgi:hypothetical protein
MTRKSPDDENQLIDNIYNIELLDKDWPEFKRKVRYTEFKHGICLKRFLMGGGCI